MDDSFACFMQMAQDFFYLFILTRGSRPLLRFLCICPDLSGWKNYFINSNGYSFSRLRSPLGPNIITNLFSAIPYIGGDLVQWIWGGFAVDNATLTRFFSLHFILPFAVAGLRIVHLLFLHQTGRGNPLGVNRNFDKVSFHPYFSSKDVFGFRVLLLGLSFICFIFPWLLGDPESFIPANPLVTPVHIQPEWYFLMAHAILRSIPNKLGGVVALALSILILLICPFVYTSKFRGFSFYPLNKLLF